jgi:sigma-B regulation protein RsbQ
MENQILTRNNVKMSGKGKTPMLFAHGFGCDQNMWRFITPAFEEEYKIIVFDYVGSGKSDLKAYNNEKYSTLNGYASDVVEICETLQLEDVIFVAHSVSSMIGILAAIGHPEIFKSLILIGPSPRYINDHPDYVGGFEESDLHGLLETMDNNYIGWANFMAPVIMKNTDRPELAQELEESFCSTDPTFARKFAEVTFFSDNRKDLQKLKVPSLILQCSEDAIAPEAVGEYLQKTLPLSSYKKMNATGHCPHMSHPEETIKLIKDFIND